MEIQVLIVDDEEQCVKMLFEEINWRHIGIHRAFGALNTDDAREILKKEKIKLILCDIEMPGESGLEFIQWIRDNSDLNGTRMECIILTCFPDYKFMRKAMQMGCSDYLIKPIDEGELYKVLEKTVNKIKDDETSENETVNFQEDGNDDIIDNRVIPYILEHYTDALTVTEIAAHAALNGQYLMRLFKKKKGCSILEYVTNCRLDSARTFLLKTEWQNDIIAEKVGYASSNYFIKLFKKQFGMTPREFRKKSFLND